jgi:NAD(P)-dependent dehydrogenase (short-subunit alcohol dehydrogenase family)
LSVTGAGAASTSSLGSVVVTGTSSGIGRACAVRLAGDGYRVFAGVRNEADGESLAAEHERIEPLPLDVTKASSIENAAKRVDETCADGGLLALVNNAGIAVPGPLEVLPLDDLRAQLEVNVVGQLAVTQALLPALRRAGGRVLFVGSVGGRLAFPYAAAYTASKHAIEAMGDALRAELREDEIEVVLIEPAVTETKIWQKAAGRTRELIASLSIEQKRRYENELSAFEERVGSADEHAADPSKVADVVARAIESKRPATRYPVGLSGKAVIRLRPFIPDRVLDAALKRPFSS